MAGGRPGGDRPPAGRPAAALTWILCAIPPPNAPARTRSPHHVDLVRHTTAQRASTHKIGKRNRRQPRQTVERGFCGAGTDRAHRHRRTAAVHPRAVDPAGRPRRADRRRRVRSHRLRTLHPGNATFTFLAQVGFALVMFVAGSHVPVRDGALRPALRVGDAARAGRRRALRGGRATRCRRCSGRGTRRSTRCCWRPRRRRSCCRSSTRCG